MPDSQPRRSSRRTQISIIIFVLAVLTASGYLYVYMKHTAALRAAEHKYTFSEYVSDHRLGKLVLIDTGTGIDPTAYVLQLSSNVPGSKREAFAENLAHLYAKYDHGALLTIVYIDGKTHKQYPIAESNYDDETKQLQLTVTLSSGNLEQINKHVDW
ncbi:hypothetical protein [Alicyclobacillus mengziensis]|uniref:Uncharacterized protein n=1 Tax=Alicyclobacillus mengziensis TaxID=2931921 RepID=A0A9X7W3Z2_9BACL|nr:hypothetical protein [Alicyclobacillus mengziensis]QSO48998.1 hypothetical protein JZ786_08735 [Alicyclobacillus mengziensis]